MIGPLLVVGDAELDLWAQVPHRPRSDEKVHATGSGRGLGGVAANAAVAAARLGVRSELLTQVGADTAGAEILTKLSRAGVVVHATRAGHSTYTFSTVDASAEKALVLIPGPLYPTVAQAEAVQLSRTSWLHTVVYDIEAATVLTSRCAAQSVPWSIDLEPATVAQGLEPLRPVLAGCDTVLVNTAASGVLGQHAAGALHAAGVTHVVFTQGGRGACWTSCSGSVRVPALPVVAVDTTGAGDCFAAAYVYSRLRGESPPHACRFATAAAGLSCLGEGAQGALPTAAAVTEALRGLAPSGPDREGVSW